MPKIALMNFLKQKQLLNMSATGGSLLIGDEYMDSFMEQDEI